MNILFLTPRDSGKNLGGVEGHVRLLTKELVRRGHEVKELSLNEVGAPVVRLPLPWSTSTRRGVATTGFGRSGDILSQVPKYRDRPKKLGKIEAWVMLWRNRSLFKWTDVIHVHDVFWWWLPFGLLNWLGVWWDRGNRGFFKGIWRNLEDFRGKKRVKPVFITFHGWEGICPPTRSAVWQKRVAAWLSDGTIGVGSFFKKWYGVETDSVVWGAVDKFEIRNLKFEIEKHVKTIVFLGRMEEVNGVEIVLRALKVGPWRTPRSDLFRRLEFVFVGEGSYRREAEKFGRVTGMVKNPWKYLVDADVVIASSYMSMLEAAAMRKPIISIANNELKMDYLNCHPLRKWIKICRNSGELTRRIASFQPRKDAILVAQEWAVNQTPEKLANEYEKLWGSND